MQIDLRNIQETEGGILPTKHDCNCIIKYTLTKYKSI